MWIMELILNFTFGSELNEITELLHSFYSQLQYRKQLWVNCNEKTISNCLFSALHNSYSNG